MKQLKLEERNSTMRDCTGWEGEGDSGGTCHTCSIFLLLLLLLLLLPQHIFQYLNTSSSTSSSTHLPVPQHIFQYLVVGDGFSIDKATTLLLQEYLHLLFSTSTSSSWRPSNPNPWFNCRTFKRIARNPVRSELSISNILNQSAFVEITFCKNWVEKAHPSFESPKVLNEVSDCYIHLGI